MRERDQAFDLIDSNTFVFAPHAPSHVNAHIFRDAPPALFIGKKLEQVSENLHRYGLLGGPSKVPLHEMMGRSIDKTFLEPMPTIETRNLWCEEMEIR